MDYAIKGVLPWFSPFAEPEEPEVEATPIHSDPQNEIETCLRCSKEECNNCLAAFDRKYHGGRPQKMTLEDLRIFLRVGDKKSACTFFGCDRTTIWRRLREEDDETETETNTNTKGQQDK